VTVARLFLEVPLDPCLSLSLVRFMMTVTAFDMGIPNRRRSVPTRLSMG
jgi:hypothetical protein